MNAEIITMCHMQMKDAYMHMPRERKKNVPCLHVHSMAHDFMSQSNILFLHCTS